MTVLQYLTQPPHGCCTTSELMALSRDDKANGTNHMQDLKTMAKAEMILKGIEITEK